MPIFVVQVWQAFESEDGTWAEGNANHIVDQARALAQQSALVNAGDPTEATSWAGVFELEADGTLTPTGHAWHMGSDGVVRDTLPTPDDDEPPAADEWQAGVAYVTGDLVTYNGTTYRCLQAHTSMAGWEPPNVPALWAVA